MEQVVVVAEEAGGGMVMGVDELHNNIPDKR
jgi:hypothetical protein